MFHNEIYCPTDLVNMVVNNYGNQEHPVKAQENTLDFKVNKIVMEGGVREFFLFICLLCLNY